MNEISLDEILAAAHDAEFSQYDNAPEHVFSADTTAQCGGFSGLTKSKQLYITVLRAGKAQGSGSCGTEKRFLSC